MNFAPYLGLACFATQLPAAFVLYQNDPTGDTFAFEAETFSAQTGNTGIASVVTTGNDPLLSGASGTEAIWVSGPGASGTQGNSTGGGPRFPNSTADRFEYLLHFASPGTYSFYARGLESIDGTDSTAFAEGAPLNNNDSFWPHASFGNSLTLNTNYSDGTATFGHPAGGNGFWDWDTRGVQITVTPAQVGTPIPWAWTWREDGTLLDRFVFTKNPLTDAELDAVMNVPEPSRAFLLLGGLVLVGLRRSRSS